jgi:hypothetical protein
MDHALLVDLEKLRAVPDLVKEVQRLVIALESPKVEEEPVPKCRPGIRALQAILTLPRWEDVVRTAAMHGVDLRDLNEHELAFMEGRKLTTVRSWRRNRTGPRYRNEAGIQYPVHSYHEWRARGAQSSTAQKVTRGGRPR